MCEINKAESGLELKAQQIGAALRKIAELQELVDAFKADAANYMEANGVKKITGEGWAMTYVEPTSTQTFDSKRFGLEHPELYKDYIKVTAKKGFVKLTAKF